MGSIEFTPRAPGPAYKSYSLRTQDLGAGDNWAAGWYMAPAAHSALTNGGPTVVFGTTNSSYAAHAFVVMSGVGTTDGTTLVLTVSGTSITDGGVRIESDTEVIVTDGTAVATDEYYESVKKWIGPITYTLTSDGGTFALTFNYGFCKYEDFGNRNFKVTDFEITGQGGANDADFDVTAYIHNPVGWTYSAGAFEPGGTVVNTLSILHGDEHAVVNNEYFAVKRAGLNILVHGDNHEGVVFKITAGAVKAANYINIHLGVVV